MAACIHYPSRKALHEANFRGIIDVVTDIIYTVSGVGTVSFMMDPSGYAANFDGVVQVLEDLNLTISGISTQASAVVSGIVGGSGVYITTSGGSSLINIGVVGEGSTNVVYSGSRVSVSGLVTSPTVISGSPGSGYNPGALWFVYLFMQVELAYLPTVGTKPTLKQLRSSQNYLHPALV